MTIRDTVGSGHLVGRPPRQQFHPRERQLPLLWPNRAPARSRLRRRKLRLHWRIERSFRIQYDVGAASRYVRSQILVRERGIGRVGADGQ